MKAIGFRCMVVVFTILMAVGSNNRESRQNQGEIFVSPNRNNGNDAGQDRPSRRDSEAGELDYGYAGTQEDIEKIGQMGNLRKLSISLRGENMDLSPLENLTELETLELDTYWGMELDTKPLMQLKQLKTITLSQCDFDLAFIAELHNLESICVVRGEVNDLSVFRDLKKLKRLSLRFTFDTDLKELQNLENLESLEITGGNIRNVECIGKLTGLRELHLDETDSYGVCGNRIKLDLEILNHMDGLESLSIGHMDIDDVEPLSRMESLEYIILADTGVTDIAPLGRLNSLRGLFILGNQSEAVKMQAVQLSGGIEELQVLEETPEAYW